MTTGLGATIVRRLTFSKYLFQLGRRALQTKTDLGAAVSVLHFHDALELFFVSVLEHHGVPLTGKEITFLGYLDKIASECGQSVEHTSVPRRCHSLRVPLKHAGQFPSRVEVDSFASDLAEFFQRNARALLEVDFKTISLADTVHDEEARKLIRAAESKINERHYQDGVGLLALAFSRLLKQARESAHARPNQRRELLPRHSVRSAMGGVDRGLSAAFERIAEELNRNFEETVSLFSLLEAGIDLSDYARFEYLSPSVWGDPPRFNFRLSKPKS